jgi:peptidoglycan L-alanyl-D-glutamate endopeptidase CwlK
MPSFSSRSKKRLEQCHPDIQKVFNEVIKHVDCTVLEGHRDQETQDEYYRQGRSKLRFPNSKHNHSPSMAIDCAPYPIDWNDRDRFYYFGGMVLGIASSMGIKMRWGGDWDMDNTFKDQTFHDLPHFELISS